jgi:4'-phosphopantetheinyl transferase
MSATLWSSPHLSPVAAADEVHVWRAWIDRPALLPALEDILTPDERERAARFHFERDRSRYVATRGLLRRILGRYLESEPSSLRFDYGPHGKPELAADHRIGMLRFNASHSGALVLVAVALGRRIGVDVECHRPDTRVEELAARFFTENENSALRQAMEGARAAGLEVDTEAGADATRGGRETTAVEPGTRAECEAFFALWSFKEAYIKATGSGFSRPANSFDVEMGPKGPRLVAVSGDPVEAARWSLRRLFPAEGYSGAVAVEGHGWHLSCWDAL